MFEELEKEVEHQFHQLQLAYGIANQSSILDSSLASLKSSLANMNPLVSLQKPINSSSHHYKASSAAPTTQLTPQASMSQLMRASVSFSGEQKPIPEEVAQSFSFVKHGRHLRQSIS